MLLLEEVWTEWSHPATLDAPRLAREQVALEFAAHDASADAVDTAKLLVTELVANVVVHVGGQLQLWAGRAGDRAYLAVEDEAPGRLPVVREPTFDWKVGRGMLLIDVMAAEWGHIVHERTKIIWCAITLGES